MDIVHIASELAPVAKVGGLADVIYGLSQSLVQKGNRVRIFLPKYDCIDYHLIENLQIIEKNLTVTENKIAIPNSIWSATFNNLELFLVEPHHPRAYFERGKIYGEEDDNDRFLYFCKVCANYLKKNPPEAIHLHDWPTAGCALFLKNGSKVVFTIHNLQHQGRCAAFNLERLGLEVDEETLRDYEYAEALNLMRGAFARSDIITAVSPSYREEILTPDQGCGLDGDLNRYKKKFKGILNGIDFDFWNPATDSFLAQKFTPETVMQGKKENKNYIRKHLSLSHETDKPLVIAITRLVAQKGPDLIYYGIEKALQLGGQFALLGSCGDPAQEEEFRALDQNPDIAIRLEYDEPLSHLLYAASDMLLMPSIFEPCGLSQMIAMRYGSIPLVRATGGLKDSVKNEENGFSFDIPDNKGVDEVLEKAFAAYHSERWPTLIQAALSADNSWSASADRYLKLYEA